jgi:hypothetical protein
MALPKLRDLDKFGVIADVDPFDLPLGAWSMALNVRFEDGRVNSAPVWRNVSNLVNASPRHVTVNNTADASVTIYTGYLDGTVKTWTSSGETDVSPSQAIRQLPLKRRGPAPRLLRSFT